MIAPHEIPRPGPAADFAASLQAALPVLRTDRLVLRGPRLEDFDTLAEILCTAQSAGMGGPPDSREDAWAEFMQLTATWLLRGHGAWTVTLNDAPIGFVLIGFEPGDAEPELGYLFTAAGEGHGYAAEACRAAMAHARDTLGMSTLVSCVHKDNARSRALARRLGATRDAAAEAALPPEDRDDTHIFRHDLTGDAQ